MVDILLYLAGGVAGAAFLLVLVRFIRGPINVDRVIAFDALTTVSMTGIVLAAVFAGRAIYLDVALVYALLSFLGVIVVARFLDREA